MYRTGLQSTPVDVQCQAGEEGSRWGMYRTGLWPTPVNVQCQMGVREEVRVIQENHWRFTRRGTALANSFSVLSPMSGPGL